MFVICHFSAFSISTFQEKHKTNEQYRVKNLQISRSNWAVSPVGWQGHRYVCYSSFVCVVLGPYAQWRSLKRNILWILLITITTLHTLTICVSSLTNMATGDLSITSFFLEGSCAVACRNLMYIHNVQCCDLNWHNKSGMETSSRYLNLNPSRCLRCLYITIVVLISQNFARSSLDHFWPAYRLRETISKPK